VHSTKWRLLAVAAVAAVVAVVAATLSPRGNAKSNAGTVEVFSLWGGSEKAAFLKLTDAFTKKTGIKIKYTAARDFPPEINSRIAAGNVPDIAIVPRPGYLSSLAKRGVLKDLSKLGFSSSYLKANYGPAWSKLGTIGGKLYGLGAKASSKTVIWYKPQSFKQYKLKVPKTWAQLLAVTKKYKALGKNPWAVGAGPGPSSWTLTDWFENIYARTAGPTKYQALFTGKLSFTDKTVVNALKLMTQIINNKYVNGGVQGALGATFQDGMAQVFGPNPKAELYMEGGFMGGIAIGQINSKLKPGKTIDFFPWPTIKPQFDHPVIGSGDLAVAFKDNSDIRSFLKYISSPAAGKIWVSTGAVIATNKRVAGSAYPNLLVRKEAQQLKSAKTFLFDGSDQLPGAFGDTWGSALQDVIQKPGNVKSILSDFQKKVHKAFQTGG
jgi:alpha-glucoside transport system substrate-binding protein